jgi:hypothetical protein
MHQHQLRILARVVDQIDEYRAGRQSPAQTLNNIWGLYTAGEIELTPQGQEFQELYLLATTADDARREFMPVGLGSDADFEASLDALRTWAIRLRKPGAGSSDNAAR